MPSIFLNLRNLFWLLPHFAYKEVWCHSNCEFGRTPMDKRMDNIIVFLDAPNLEKGGFNGRHLLAPNDSQREQVYYTHNFDHFNNN
jgi:hypothetical protein